MDRGRPAAAPKKRTTLRLADTELLRWVGAHAEKIVSARGDPERLLTEFGQGVVPMVIVDDHRRYVDANQAAQSALALSRDELRLLRLDDLTLPVQQPMLEAGWKRLMETGCVTTSELGLREGSYPAVTSYSVAGILPGRHLVTFAPAGWPVGDHDGGVGDLDAELTSPLTPRELEVLELAAYGRNGPMLADELSLSTATVRTHFANIYRKLDVGDRAAAVAKAMRLGLFR